MDGFGELVVNGIVVYKGEFKNNQFNGRGELLNEEPDEGIKGDLRFEGFNKISRGWIRYKGWFKND